MNATLDKTKGSSQPLGFYLEELPGGSANSQIPLLVRVDMANFDVRRVLIDPGSSCDIMYAHLFQTLQLNESHLTPYLGSDLQGFNGATTKPWGYVDLIVTFGEDETARSIKYYTTKGQVATLHEDIEAARRCFEAASKGHSYVGKAYSAKKPKSPPQQPPQQPAPNVSSVDLDWHHSKKELKEEKKLRKEKKEADAASKENHRPIPDGEFKLIPLGEDPSKGVKIGKDLPDLARKQLKACLKENADMFAWSTTEMPGLDPEVACHQLAVDPAASVIVQRRRRQSPEKAEAAEKAVKDLLEANFIYEANRPRVFRAAQCCHYCEPSS
ncbi:hypothetical protein A2U01_0016002 [Trifolium medium]|uniref:Gag-pol polyprotein n=1 Tax=Trifolium medium TaxID=97028 RepID=A0A392N776_9FABA|nr:hypothetical protein [Trifolium medium]